MFVSCSSDNLGLAMLCDGEDRIGTLLVVDFVCAIINFSLYHGC